MTATPIGRPLRALGLLLLGWALVRAAIHTGALEWTMPAAYAESVAVRGSIMMHSPAPVVPMRLAAAAVRFPLPASTLPRPSPMANRPPLPMPARTFLFAIPAAQDAPPPAGSALPLPPGPPPVTTASIPLSRWTFDGWTLWRPGSSPAALARSGQLGGAQAGLRLAYDLSPHSRPRLALYARLTGALRDPVAPEAALGIGLQPSRAVPVMLGIERRIALDGDGRSAFALLAAGGFGPALLAPGLWAEGYGQAGVVGLRRRDAFADGRLALLHDLQGSPFALGVMAAGGVQPHVSRIDIGPAVQARFSLGGKPFRLTAEWRRRVAGRARPGSGPAVTLATSF